MSDPSKEACDLIASQCLFGRARHLARRLTAIYDEAVRDLGLTASQLNVMVIAGRAGPVPMGRLADIMGMSPSTASRTLERMASHGWLRLSPGEDGRTQMVGLDTKGRELIQAALPRWKSAQRKAEKLLGRDDAGNLRDLVNRLRS